MTTPCPQPDRLQALLDGDLPEDHVRLIAEHLEYCEPCRQRLEKSAGEVPGMPDSTQPADGGHAASSPAMQQAMDRLRAADPDSQPQPASEAGQEGVEFLRPSDKPGYIGRFGPYDVIEVVGRGGMGIVLKARDPSLHRIVAIKVLAPALAANALARRRFIREARTAASVSHEHVVTIHAVDEVDGLPYLMMQFIAGPSLQARIDKSGPLKLEEILRIGMQTALGLEAAHALGVVHRDIKPGNILLENGIERAMLTDFGLARAVHDAAITQTGLIAGTPQYMAPEQVRDEPIDHRADLFSLGGVLYAMCTGCAPFSGSTPLSVMRKVCETEPTPIREINEEVPPWLAEIVNRLLTKDRSQRYQSAGEVARLLGERLARLQSPKGRGEDRAADVPSGAQLQPREGRRARRWAVRLAVGILLVALVAAVLRPWTPWRPHPDDEEEPGPPSAPRPSQTFRVLAEGSRPERTFGTLAEAVDAAQSGDTIEVCWDGAFQTKPILIGRNKSLVIRAGEGSRPTIEVLSDRESLLLADGASLVLEGLTLGHGDPGDPKPWEPRPPQRLLPKALITCHEARLHAAHCRFLVRGPAFRGPRPTRIGIALGCVPSCELRSCEFYGEYGAAINWSNRSPPTNADEQASVLRMHNCVHVGTEVLQVDYNGRQAVSFCLSRNTLLGARLLCEVVGLPPDASGSERRRGESRLIVDASENVLDFNHVLATLQPLPVQSWLVWKGRRNVFAVEGQFITAFRDRRMVPDGAEQIVARNLQEWSKFWSNTDGDSRSGAVRYPGGRRFELHGSPPLPPHDSSSARQFGPQDLRLVSVKSEGGDAQAAEELAGYGADVERVGPGGPYDAWRQSAEYQRWLEDVKRAVTARE